MATQTVVKFEDFKADGTVRRVRYLYDDVSLFLTAVLMFNNTTDIPLPAKATVNANGRSFSRTEPPGGPTAVEFVQTIATNAAQRMELFVNATNGRLDGVDWQIG
jgi:hypothetical protein